MVPRLVVFDLDGTLIDSQIDLSNSVNATLVHLGRPELPHAVIAGYIGDGVGLLVRRALGDPEGDVHDEEFVNDAVRFFLDYYREHKLDFTYVYAGVMEALGMRREGCFLRDRLIKDAWRDTYLYALLDDEWSRRP